MMEGFSSESDIWEAIELSESYMICCMFKEAISLASSILQQLQSTSTGDGIQKSALIDIRESAGMVIVQSLKESGRIKDIFAELEVLFGSINAIPGQVFVTGICMQLSEGLTSALKPILEQFLGTWKFIDGCLVFSGSFNENVLCKHQNGHHFLDLEHYMDLVDIYVIQLLAVALQKVDLAILWTKNTELPDEKRQDLLRRLHLLNVSSLSAQQTPKQSPNDGISGTKLTSKTEGVVDTVKIRSYASETQSKFSIIKIIQPFLWRFSPANVDIAITCFMLRYGKVVTLGSLAVLISYVLQRKRMVIKRLAIRLVYSTRIALIDAWRLAFTVQVNPLAAVQPLTSVSQGNR